MNAALTGGTGFLGGPLVRRLSERFDEVRVMVRRLKDDARIRAMGGVPVRGDLTVAGGCDGLVRPGDVVFHAAARVDLRGSWSTFRRTTVDGTRRLLEASLARGASRFVYISSAAVYPPEAAGTPVRADHTPATPPRFNYYGRAKLLAESLVRDECDRAGCPWTILRLGFCYGPGNRVGIEQFVRMRKRDRLFVIGGGENRIATCYSDDAARAVVLAGTSPLADGKIYDVASDEPVTQRRFLDAMAEATGLPKTRRRARFKVAYAAAFVADMLAKIPGCEPPYSRMAVMLMGTDQIIDAARTRDDLGWRPEVTFAEGMRRTAEWYEQMGGRRAATRAPVIAAGSTTR
ncbi:MAG: NAD(P)-dependent oxidoreductase [Phycisphaerae bacterium]|nr:NAD(P)-dependent oxidoreductase [Phycisphaerae bacterium]